MGTSVNQRSAPTANWAAAQAGYRSEIPVERVVQEIWRAATNQPSGDLARLLGEPIVAQVGLTAAEGGTPAQVASATSREIARSKQASLAAEISTFAPELVLREIPGKSRQRRWQIAAPRAAVPAHYVAESGIRLLTPGSERASSPAFSSAGPLGTPA